MTDNLSPEKRSWNMSRIKSCDTKPEILLRSMLHREGFRFRKNVKGLPGKPDIVLPKYNTIIFVHGCFWHRHKGCKKTRTPKSNIEFWENKFKHNILNDRKNVKKLRSLGWQVLIVWECQLKEPAALIRKIKKQIVSNNSKTPDNIIQYPEPEISEQAIAAEKQAAYTTAAGNKRDKNNKK